MGAIYHLAVTGDWEAARRAGRYEISTRGLTLAEVGFIHCSHARQVATVARTFYADAGELTLLYVDPNRLGVPVVDEHVEAAGDSFPHVFGPIDVDAVVATSATSADRMQQWGGGPRPLTVGVTGHRHLAGPVTVAERVAVVAASFAERAGDPGWRVVSALAEGADRIVAAAATAAGAELVALLPMEPADYAADFLTAESRAEFDRLLAAAATVEVTEGNGSREAAYERAGFAMLDRCDALVALWDGEPARGQGGTADMIAAAERRGLEVVVVAVERAS